MPREFSRSRRVEEEIQRIVAEILRQRVRDPRLQRVIITDVRVSRDLSVARLYFSVMPVPGDALDPAMLATSLEKASGFIRRELAQALKVRAVPELRFSVDDGLDQARRLDQLIDEAVGRPSADASDDTPPER
ncbi:MAG: 30S ribosome-binding factor RbfA [Chromatiales bacterium]|nr:30S ribosome-binding factor RbfA [Chromatiales bacterium]